MFKIVFGLVREYTVSITYSYHYVLGMDSFNLDLRRGSPLSSVHGVKQLK